MKLIILGPPASGKGTQAEFLGKELNIPTISMGQILRNKVEEKSEIGKQVEEFLNKGDLVPNSITNELLWKRLEREDCKNRFILDGFPRTKIQAKFLNKKQNIDKVILVDISDKEVMRRLSGRRTCLKCGDIYHIEFNPSKKENVCDKCGGKLELREDDTPEGIHQRLKIYHSETQDVIEYYQERNILIKINGEQSIEDVRDEIFRKLKV